MELGVATTSRDIAPGTHVTNLTALGVEAGAALGEVVGAAGAVARVGTHISPPSSVAGAGKEITEEYVSGAVGLTGTTYDEFVEAAKELPNWNGWVDLLAHGDAHGLYATRADTSAVPFSEVVKVLGNDPEVNAQGVKGVRVVACEAGVCPPNGLAPAQRLSLEFPQLKFAGPDDLIYVPRVSNDSFSQVKPGHRPYTIGPRQGHDTGGWVTFQGGKKVEK